MFDVISVLEGVCAWNAAAKMEKKDFAKLERLHSYLEDHFNRQELKAYIHINNSYHSYVQELAGNNTLNQIVNGLRQKIQPSPVKA